MSTKEGGTFIILDPRGKRWVRLRLLLLVLGIVGFAGAVLFAKSLFVTPKLQLPSSIRLLQARLKTLKEEDLKSRLQKAKRPLWLEFSKARKESPEDSPIPA